MTEKLKWLFCMSNAFKILSSSNENVAIVPVTDVENPGPKFSEKFVSLGDYGSMEFQKLELHDLALWISTYKMNAETKFYAEVFDPILEAHITLKNVMVQSLGKKSNSILDQKQFNITYAPGMENRVLFPKGGEYMTFDIHPHLSILKNLAEDFPELEKFINKKMQRPDRTIQLFRYKNILNYEMEYAVNGILRHISNPFATKSLTTYLSLELLTMFLLRSCDNFFREDIIRLTYTDPLFHAKQIIEKEALTFDNEDLFSTEIQIAEKVGISLYKFKTGFKKLFNITPYQMNLDIRLNKAQRLLLDTHLSIIEIALRTGFHTREGLIKAYKRHFKTTPTEGRKLDNW